MKTYTLLFVMFLACVGQVSGQTILLTFTATLNGNHQPLDSISIENLTQGGDTALYGNDTVLILQQSIGTEHPFQESAGELVLCPPSPNPFDASTTIQFYLARQELVTIRVSDLSGREVARFSERLEPGIHHALFHAGEAHCYVLSVETPRQRQVQNLISIDRTGGTCQLEYTGGQSGAAGMKKEKGTFPWATGDNLRFIGFTSNGADTIDAQPLQSTLYTFQYLPQLPLPVANFSASDTVIHQNDTVQFTDLSLHSPTTWKWYFGDGDSSVLQNPSHIYIYMTTGNFSVSLIAGNASGYDTLTKANHINVVSSTCPPTVTDINGNIYNTVQIGTQCWMKENLKVQNYRNGTTIPNITDSLAWVALSTGARCWYNNDSAIYAATYGALYNWPAVDDTNGLCPTGWHVPTDAEWTILTDFLGGLSVAGGPLKETGTIHWISPNTGATNSTGFTALPGGHRVSCDGCFVSIGSFGGWWTSTAKGMTQSHLREMYYNYSAANKFFHDRTHGYSVRCLSDSMCSSAPTISTDSVSAITATSAVSGGNVYADGGAVVTARGVCWSTSPSPDIFDNTTSNGTGTGSFTSNITCISPSTTYYVRAYATNIAGTAYGNQVVFTTPGSIPASPCPGMPTMTDYNGNIYNTIQIGTQCWMQENLKARNYKNGTVIPNITDDTTWAGLSTGAICWYNNDSASYAATYGALYNWYAVDDANGLCPTGWHVPTDPEWQTLEMFLGMSQAQAGSTGLRGTDEGGKMKEAGLAHWYSPNTCATNVSGFTALPGGGRNLDGSFVFLVLAGHWWSSSANSTTIAWSRQLSNYYSLVNRFYINKKNGYSVRCMRDY
ncbi:MAG TPA: FISUMP domain-containing protein [Bacteroidales bacterium]|nr:FISUMP domain-containing protein [Bacteroidales bacterium]HRZ48554.1 FISUMP domain-containing protein [Bacteroidales bacterium]